MTTAQEHKPIVMPYNPSIASLSVQDIINYISGNIDPDDDEQEAAIAYLEQSSYQDRIHIADIIIDQETGHRHMLEGIADQVHAHTMAELSAIAQDEAELPELGPFTLQAVNTSRLRWNILRMTISEMAPPGTELYQKLARSTMEQQETIELAIQEALTEHQAQLDALKQEIFATLQSKLENVLPETQEG